MIGRAAYENPYLFATVDRDFYGETAPPPTRREVVEGLLPYLEDELSKGARLNHVTRHVLGLFAGQPGAKAWKRYLSENAHKPGAGVGVVQEAVRRVPGEVLDARPADGLSVVG